MGGAGILLENQLTHGVRSDHAARFEVGRPEHVDLALAVLARLGDAAHVEEPRIARLRRRDAEIGVRQGDDREPLAALAPAFNLPPLPVPRRVGPVIGKSVPISLYSARSVPPAASATPQTTV